MDSVEYARSIESLANAIHTILPDAKMALVRMVGTPEDRGDVMSILLLSDQLAFALKCPNRNAMITPEEPSES